ncbi:hypothetical protein CR513_26519, partial [Mucuna pruriens]
MKLSHIKGSGPPRDDPKVMDQVGPYQGLKMCKVDSIAYSRLVERERIFKFLHGLNFEYNPIRVQILSKEKLPSLSELFKIVYKTSFNSMVRVLFSGKNMTLR